MLIKALPRLTWYVIISALKKKRGQKDVSALGKDLEK
jgi:hypothetical protein